MQFNFFSVPLIVASLLMFFLGLMIRPYKSTPGVRYFSLLMFAGGIYSFLYALEISSLEPSLIEIFYTLQYLAIPFIPAFFIIFVACYTRKTEVENPVYLIIISIVPVLTALFAVTHNLHTFFIRSGYVDTTGAFPVYVFTPGPWYWVYQLFTITASLFGIILLFRMYINSAPAFRRQVGIILAGSVIPFIVYVFYIGGMFPEGFDANPFSFAFTGIVIFTGISRFKLFSLAPLARNMLFDSIPDGVIVLDKYFRLVDINRSSALTFGTGPDEIGKPAGEVFKEWPEIKANLAGTEKSKSFEISRVTEGRDLFLNCVFSPLIDERNVERGLMLIVHDVTKQRKAEIDKYKSEEKFRIIFENAPVGLMYFDSDGIVKLCNNYFLRILDSDERTMIGTNVWQLSDNRIQDALKKTFQGKRVVFEGSYTTESRKKKVFIKSILKPLLSKNKEVEGGLCIVEDISGRKAYEDRIKLANEELKRINAEKDRFFSILAHDLRSPFTAFLGYTDFLEESLDNMPVESVKTIASSMKESANNLYGLLENLLQWSRMQQGLIDSELEKITLLDKVLCCIEPLLVYANNKMIDVSYEIPASIKVMADNKMFDTVIRNLFTNAVKFTPKQGSIKISARETDDQVEICFSDTGIGMTPQIVDNLFRLDVKTSRPGTDGELSTGLGLILVRELVEIQGGSVRVESEKGKGSRFFLRFNKPGINVNT